MKISLRQKKMRYPTYDKLGHAVIRITLQTPGLWETQTRLQRQHVNKQNDSLPSPTHLAINDVFNSREIYC